MKVPLVLQRTLDSAVSVGTRIGLRKKTASDANDAEDERVESDFRAREVRQHPWFGIQSFDEGQVPKLCGLGLDVPSESELL